MSGKILDPSQLTQNAKWQEGAPSFRPHASPEAMGRQRLHPKKQDLVQQDQQESIRATRKAPAPLPMTATSAAGRQALDPRAQSKGATWQGGVPTIAPAPAPVRRSSKLDKIVATHTLTHPFFPLTCTPSPLPIIAHILGACWKGSNEQEKNIYAWHAPRWRGHGGSRRCRKQGSSDQDPGRKYFYRDLLQLLNSHHACFDSLHVLATSARPHSDTLS